MRVTIINQRIGETSFTRVTITVRYPLRARLFSGCSHRLETTDVFLRLTASRGKLYFLVRSFARTSTCAAHPSKSHRRLSVARFPGARVPAGILRNRILTVRDSSGCPPTAKKKQKRVKSRVFAIAIWRPFPFYFLDRPTDSTDQSR